MKLSHQLLFCMENGYLIAIWVVVSFLFVLILALVCCRACIAQSNQNINMGNSPSHPVYTALNELLRSKNLKLKQSMLAHFLSEVDVAAPWFTMSGALTVPSWDKLGHDLDFAFEQGTLKGGVHPVWKLVKGCLTDQRCSSALETSKAALEILQGERSEANSVRQTSGRERDIPPRRRKRMIKIRYWMRNSSFSQCILPCVRDALS